MRKPVLIRLVGVIALAVTLAACSAVSAAPRPTADPRSVLAPLVPSALAALRTPQPRAATATVVSLPTVMVGSATPTSGPALPVPVYGYQIVKTYPHDPDAFTQGLVYVDGVLYEGTGLNGRSSLRRVDLESGQVLQRRDLAEEYFGEGIAVFGKRIIQLTWRSRVGFVYDRETFALQRQFSYPTEGWGLTHDGKSLIMSDGTATLRWLDPENFAETRSVVVRDQNGPVVNLNELEYIRGEVYANIWQTDRIARIDPQTGRVTGWIDLQGLLSLEERQSSAADVLNGIAYDAANDRLFVTGKLWPKLFEIKLIPPNQNPTVTPSAARKP